MRTEYTLYEDAVKDEALRLGIFAHDLPYDFISAAFYTLRDKPAAVARHAKLLMENTHDR